MVFTLETGDNSNSMATVRMTLAAAGLMVCGLAFANGAEVATHAAASTTVAASTSVTEDADAPAASAASKPNATKASAGSTAGSRKAAKTSIRTKAASGAKSPVSGRMQVEEPKSAAPMSPARESKAWQKNHSRGLTDAQKNAFRERKESMESMIAVIKEKRKALRDAKPEERAALARELHSLILEKDPVANSPASTTSSTVSTARVLSAAPENPHGADKSVPEAKSPGQASERKDMKKAEAAEAAEFRRKRIEANQEQFRRKEEIRKQQIDKLKSSFETGFPPVGDLSEGNEED
jgi:hypothetical protein